MGMEMKSPITFREVKVIQEFKREWRAGASVVPGEGGGVMEAQETQKNKYSITPHLSSGRIEIIIKNYRDSSVH